MSTEPLAPQCLMIRFSDDRDRGRGPPPQDYYRDRYDDRYGPPREPSRYSPPPPRYYDRYEGTNQL